MIKLWRRLLSKDKPISKQKKDSDPYLYAVLEIQNEKYNF